MLNNQTDQTPIGKPVKYKKIKHIGKGAFGVVFKAINLESLENEKLAIKYEKRPKQSKKSQYQYSQLFTEAKMYSQLQPTITVTSPLDLHAGVPKLISCHTEGDYNVMIMELLGPSLEDLFCLCDRKFTLKTVLMLAVQMISRIEYVHSKNILHRDIKPGNFAIGRGKKKDKIFLIDYGLSSYYIDNKLKHVAWLEGFSMIGTVRYASINTHKGINQGRRDDLESLGYVLLYFLLGRLP